MEHANAQVPMATAHARSRSRVVALLLVIALLGWTLLAGVFVVDVTQYGLVTRFGEVVRVVSEPGLHIKAPFDTVLRLEKSLTFSRPGQAEYLTVDKKNIVAESLVTWRIADPERYLVTLATRSAADLRLADVMLGEVGAVLGTHAAVSLIAPDGSTGLFRKIVGTIRERAQRIKAEGDAEATRIYSAAFSRNPAFYKFLRTLQAYEKFMDENTTLFLPANSEVLRVLGPLPRQGAASPSHHYATARTHDPAQPGAGAESTPLARQSAEPERSPR